VRRQSVDAVDLFYGHIGGIDTVAKGLLNAAAIIEDGRVDAIRAKRYAGWTDGLGGEIANLDLAGIADLAVERDLKPAHKSGQQERLENLINRFV
jgi:xylose isomerase